jgi:hypothetical protein
MMAYVTAKLLAASALALVLVTAAILLAALALASTMNLLVA